MEHTTGRVVEVAARRSPVVRALGLVRWLGGSVLPALGSVLRYAAAGFLVMLAAAGLLSTVLPDAGLLPLLGRWALAAVYGVAGLVGGALLGLNVAASRGVGAFQEQVRGAFARITPAEADRLVPRVPLEEARATYDRVLDDVVDRAVVGVRLPRPFRALLRRRLRQHAIEAFLAECEERGAASVGFGELRDWLVDLGMPMVTAPARAQLRSTRLVLAGGGVLLIAITVVLALPRLWPAVLAGLPVGLAAVGALTIAVGLPGAGVYERPWRRRLGVVVLGASLALWPVIWIRLAAADLGMVWIVVFAATVASVGYGFRMAFVEANRPRILP